MRGRRRAAVARAGGATEREEEVAARVRSPGSLKEAGNNVCFCLISSKSLYTYL